MRVRVREATGVTDKINHKTQIQIKPPTNIPSIPRYSSNLEKKKLISKIPSIPRYSSNLEKKNSFQKFQLSEKKTHFKNSNLEKKTVDCQIIIREHAGPRPRRAGGNPDVRKRDAKTSPIMELVNQRLQRDIGNS